MVRRSEFENSLEQIGRRPVGLTVDDVGEVVGAAMATQRQHLVQHMNRLFRLQQLRGAPNDQRLKNLHRRLVEVEAEIRALKRGGAR